MGNHSAPLTMIMMIEVGIVQHYMVEGGGSVNATTVSLLVTMNRTIGMMGQDLKIFHMWR